MGYKVTVFEVPKKKIKDKPVYPSGSKKMSRGDWDKLEKKTTLESFASAPVMRPMKKDAGWIQLGSCLFLDKRPTKEQIDNLKRGLQKPQNKINHVIAPCDKEQDYLKQIKDLKDALLRKQQCIALQNLRIQELEKTCLRCRTAI